MNEIGIRHDKSSIFAQNSMAFVWCVDNFGVAGNELRLDVKNSRAIRK